MFLGALDSSRWLFTNRRERYRCRRCGAPKPLTVHHIKPRDQGGIDDVRNLLTLCAACHDYAEPEPDAGR